MRIGIDIDGVLADFVSGYATLIKELTGKDVPLTPLHWNWTRDFGVTREDEKVVWDAIKDPKRHFWWRLQTLGQSILLRDTLVKLTRTGADLYFITSRPGVNAKSQTEAWLENYGVWHPTVLIDSGGKGSIARGLGLTHFIDDRPENIEDVANWSLATRLFLRDASYNQELQQDRPPYIDFQRVADIHEFAAQFAEVPV